MLWNESDIQNENKRLVDRLAEFGVDWSVGQTLVEVRGRYSFVTTEFICNDCSHKHNHREGGMWPWDKSSPGWHECDDSDKP